MPKFPNVKVKLTGKTGNAFNIINECKRVAYEAEVPAIDVCKFVSEAMSGDYQHLLKTASEYFDIS